MKSARSTTADGKNAPPDGTPSDDNLGEELRSELHGHIDSMFERSKTGFDIYCECLSLAGRLMAQAFPYIDLIVARELPEASLAASERARDEARALLNGVDGKSAVSTAGVGLIGAHKTVEQLAVYTADPYLSVLATALGQLRLGQVHPWLVPVKTAVHPSKHASDVLGLKAIPFSVIDYLVASGLYPTKTQAAPEVCERLGISADTLNGWRKQQRKLRPAQFDLERRMIALIGPEVSKAREKMVTMPELRVYVEAQDRRFGLSAIDWVAKALKAADAHKGQK